MSSVSAGSDRRPAGSSRSPTSPTTRGTSAAMTSTSRSCATSSIGPERVEGGRRLADSRHRVAALVPALAWRGQQSARRRRAHRATSRAPSNPPTGTGYDPHDPVPSWGFRVMYTGGSTVSGPYEQTRVERRDDVLVYTSAPLDETRSRSSATSSCTCGSPTSAPRHRLRREVVHRRSRRHVGEPGRRLPPRTPARRWRTPKLLEPGEEVELVARARPDRVPLRAGLPHPRADHVERVPPPRAQHEHRQPDRRRRARQSSPTRPSSTTPTTPRTSCSPSSPDNRPSRFLGRVSRVQQLTPGAP